MLDKIKKIICEASENVCDWNDINVVLPPEELREKFDVSTNLPMVLAKKLNTTPAKLAVLIIDNISFDYVEFAEHVSPVFINIKMRVKFWQDAILNIDRFKNIGQGEKVNIEFVSANPTGPMHIGHTRGAVYGDVLATLLQKSGFDVTREFYVNDAGGQIAVLEKSFLFRLEQVRKNDFSEPMPDGCYPGDYLIELAQNFSAKGEINREYILDAMLNLIKQDLIKLKVKHDKFTSEKAITDAGKIDEAFKILQQKNLIYKGKLEAPKGKLLEDWEGRDQDLFKSTDFGDDVDRPLKKSDESYTYFAGDVGYHYDKLQRGYKKMVLILGSDHKGYKKRISAAVNALSDGKAEIDAKLCEIVNFLKNGEPVKMSKRAGNFLLASDVLSEVDPDIIRFMMLTRRNDTILNFDFEKVKEQSKDNPVFYVQYANARCASVFRKATEQFGQIESTTADLSNPQLRELAIKLCYYPEIVNTAVKNYEPHLLISYIVEVASQFHSIWNSGFKFVDTDIEQTKKNLVLIFAVKNVIMSVLDVCNIKPLDKM